MLVLFRPREQQRPPQLAGQGTSAGDCGLGVTVAGDLVLVAVGLNPGVAGEGPGLGTPTHNLCVGAGNRERGQSCLLAVLGVRFQLDFDITGSGNFLNKTKVHQQRMI